MNTKKSIPQALKDFIDKYFNLNILGIDVVAPYHMNTKGMLFQKPVFSGKASPEEIEEIANKIFHKSDFRELNNENIRKEMINSHLGIDCSGMVYQMFNYWLKSTGKGELKDYLPEAKGQSWRTKLSRKFKPQSSVNAHMFTSEPISSQISLEQIKPGDLIRTRGGKHILFVTEVEYDKNNLPKIITVVHSTNKYKDIGVRYEYIELNEKMELASAKWTSQNPGEVNETYKGYRVLMESNGVFRPNLPLEAD